MEPLPDGHSLIVDRVWVSNTSERQFLHLYVIKSHQHFIQQRPITSPLFSRYTKRRCANFLWRIHSSHSRARLIYDLRQALHTKLFVSLSFLTHTLLLTTSQFLFTHIRTNEVLCVWWWSWCALHTSFALQLVESWRLSCFWMLFADRLIQRAGKYDQQQDYVEHTILIHLSSVTLFTCLTANGDSTKTVRRFTASSSLFSRDDIHENAVWE